MNKRRVLVTGGSRGIGAECVREFSLAGDVVCFLYASNDAAAQQVGQETRATAIKCDISDTDAVSEAVKQAFDVMGGVDVLVNCAGISQIKCFDEISDQDWDRMLGTNLSGAFYVSRACVGYMIKEKKGRIINIGSMWGKVGASCEVHYSAAKGGLRTMTMAQAKELGPSGITVNCIEPGVIDTDMNASLDEATLRELCDETPLGRLGTPADVAKAVMFLASDEASFITGQIIGVDGGFAV